MMPLLESSTSSISAGNNRELDTIVKRPTILLSRRDQLRLFAFALLHSILGGYSEPQAYTANYLHVQVQALVNSSFIHHYGVVLNAKQFALLWSSVSSCHMIGVLLTALILGQCMDRFGRKATALVLRPGVAIVASLLELLAKYTDTFELFAFGHFMTGVSGTLKIALLIYLAECVPEIHRGRISLFVGLASGLFGTFLAELLCIPPLFGNDKYWQFFPLVPLALAVGHLFYGLFVPESPKFLYMTMGERKASTNALRYYHARKRIRYDSIFEAYDREASLSETTEAGLMTVLKMRHLRIPLLICLCASLTIAFSVSTIRAQYSTQLLVSYGIPLDVVTLSLLPLGLITAPISLFVSPILTERAGRRTLMSICYLTNIAQTVIVMAVQFKVEKHGPSFATALSGWLGFLVGNISTSSGLILFSALLFTDIVPHAARGVVTAVSTFCGNLLATVLTFTHPPLLALFGGWAYTHLLLMSILGWLLLVIYMPETKGRRVGEIVARYRKIEDGEDENERQPLILRSSYSEEDTN